MNEFLKKAVLRKFRGLELVPLATKAITCEEIPPVLTRVHALNWTVTNSPDLSELLPCGVRGTLFRKGRQVEHDDETQVSRSPQSSVANLFTGNLENDKHPNDKKTAVSLEFFYELLYPPLDEEILDVSGIAALHKYQRVGIQFLLDRTSALLADDMGLGKTAQVSVALKVLFKQSRITRVLVICPKSIVQQWKSEAMRWGGFVPTIVTGRQDERAYTWKYISGVVIATPHIVFNDISIIQNEEFDIVVCDDVSMLKNPGQITTAIRSTSRHRSWCLNGTPLENKPEDLANVMEFVKSGLFSNSERLRAPRQREMEMRIAPYFLRRRKTDYLDLPEKVMVGPILCDLEGHQLKAYKEAEMCEWQALNDSGVKVTKIHIFAVIRALIRLCNYHPASGTSAKLELLQDELDQILSDKVTKAIVFAQDVEALKFLQTKLSQHSPVLYDGGLSEGQRKAVLDQFKGKETNLLLGSIKACSRGLNLQHANYVFHFDRTWNPMDERQAEDRCWRMGQKKPVFVYRYLLRNTVEQRIFEVLNAKNQLFDSYIDNHSQTPDELEKIIDKALSIDDLLQIVKPSEPV